MHFTTRLTRKSKQIQNLKLRRFIFRRQNTASIIKDLILKKVHSFVVKNTW